MILVACKLMCCEYCKKNEINNFDTKKLFHLYEIVIAGIQGQGIRSILLDLVGYRDMEGFFNIKLGDICMVETNLTG